jgi:Bifunctional DNA primase/polymerase, N-terminal
MSLPDLAAPALEWVQWYIGCGAFPIPVPFKSKIPTLEKWQDLRLTPETASEHFNGGPRNVGLLLGAVSGDLVDVDLDCREAVLLAPLFLPDTPAKFGRKSTGAAHWMFRTRVMTTKFADVDKGRDGERAMLVELRSDGCQTIAPPSVHPSAERVVFLDAQEFNPAAVDGGALLARTRMLATAALLSHHWPSEGARHDAALGAAGFLLHVGVPLDDVVLVVTAAAQVAGDTEWRARRADVMSTHDRLEDSAAVVGGPTLAAALRGDGAAVIKQLKRWFEIHRSAESRWHPPEDRPVIDTANLGLDEMADVAWAAIEGANEPPRVYRYGTALAWMAEDPAGRPQIEVMGENHVRHHLAQIATFIRWTPARPGRAAERKPAFPPIPLAADLLAVPRSTLPRLQRLVRVPVFTASGGLLTEPGYDPASRLYFAPPASLALPEIAERPTADDIAAALALLSELLQDFPFLTPTDHAHAIALLLTNFLRELIGGDIPLFVVSKPTPRTGAGLLVKVMGLVQDGVPPAPKTISRDEDEMRKRLTSFLLPSPSLILLDNLHGRLESPALAAILTCGGLWDDRLLGKTQVVTVPVRSTFVVTGNNPALSNEIAGRSVLIRLDPKVEDPSARTGFRHPRLEVWTLEHRGRLLWAALTLGQAWIAAGRPLADVAFGGFDEWAAVLGGVLKVAGVPTFLGNRQTLFDQADEENAEVRAFLADWWEQHGAGDVAVKELLDIAKNHALNISSRSEQGQLVSLGRLVAGIEDRPYDLGEGLRVAVRRGGRRKRAVLWRLAHESSESASLVSLFASTHTGTRERAESAGGDSPNSADSPEEVPF